MSDPIRLSKLLTLKNICSRREADKLIEAGLVEVNGEILDTLGVKVDPDSEVRVIEEGQDILDSKVTVILNKPVGYVSGPKEEMYKSALDLITKQNRFAECTDKKFSPVYRNGMAPAGRLDIDSTGLLILTQNGTVAKKLIGENTDVEKEYLVRVNGTLSDDDLKLLNHGLSIDGVKLKPAKVSWQNEDQLKFILKQGKKRQIRKMCELVGLEVTGLKRVRIGKLTLSNLPLGEWRYLAPGEDF